MPAKPGFLANGEQALTVAIGDTLTTRPLLGHQLRENLKRRKSQARGRSDGGASSETADASLDDASGEEP